MSSPTPARTAADDTAPALMPRRMVLAAVLAGVAAAGAVGLAMLGEATLPETESFRFARGTTLAAGEEARLAAWLARAAADDRIAVTITGHSGTSGDAGANLDLSRARAEMVAGMAREAGVGADRLAASGVGGGDPLPRAAGQGERAWQAALARVEVAQQVRR